MADLVFILITFAFFAVCVAYVQLCDRIIGPDPAVRESYEERQPGEMEEVAR